MDKLKDFRVVLLEFTPLEFETNSKSNEELKGSIELEFTPLEFETRRFHLNDA